MQHRAHEIARLRTIAFLIEEALRISDDGTAHTVGCALSLALDHARNELEKIETGSPPTTQPR